MYTLPHVLQRFPKHRVVYEFVNGLFLFICCLIPEFFVHPYVGLYLAFLHELFCGYHSLPGKLPLRQSFTHSPIVKVVRVKILDVIVWIVWAVVFSMRIVGFCIPLAHHCYPIARSFFDEQIHTHFCQQFQLHSCLFQQVITRQARRCLVMIWIHSTLFQEYASEVLKKHPLRSKHPFWDKNHDNPPNVCTQTLSTLFLHVCIVFALCACHSNLPLTLEHSFVLQFCFAKALPPIHVYTLSLCLLLSPSRETKELHCFPWGCGKRLEVGLAQALSANLCCKRCAPFHGIFLASSSDLSQRLYSFSVSKAPSSTTIFLAVFCPFVYFIQWLRLVSWSN